jgi:Membrane bound beta barrel domain (DUF5777)
MRSLVARGIFAAVILGRCVPAAAQEAAPPPPAPASPAQAPEADETPAARPWLPPEGNLLVTLPTDETLGRGMLQFLVTHRFRDPVRGSNAHTLYSLDSGADFGVGFTYVPVPKLEVALYRSSVQDDYELSAKWAPFSGSDSAFGAALRVGGGDRRDPIIVDESGSILPDSRARTSFFAQGIVSLHLLGRRLELSAVPTYSSRTSAERRAFNVPVHAAFAIFRSLNLQGEYLPPRKGIRGSIAQWSIGVEKVLYRHRFSLVVTNTTLTTVDETLSGDYGLAQKRQQRNFENGYRNNNWHIGFNLVRQFKVGS